MANRRYPIQLRPLESLPLEGVVQTIANDILPSIRMDAASNGVTIKLEGAASACRNLDRDEVNVMTAILIIFLLLVILLRNFIFADDYYLGDTGISRWWNWRASRSKFVFTPAPGYADNAWLCHFDWGGGQ